MNKKDLIFGGVIVMLLGVAILLFSLLSEKRSDYKEQVELYNSITDTVKFYRNKDSLNVAKIQVMQTDKESDFLKIKNLTGTNLELQNLIRNKDKKIKDLNTALIHKDETVYVDTLRMYYPIGGDTIIFSQSVLLDTVNNKWINAKYGFNRGLSYLDLRVYNEYQITIGYEGGNLFKKGTPYGIVTNMNPYTSTKDMRVYQVSVPKQKRMGISFQTGFGGVYDMKNSNISYGPYIGLGLNYNIIKW
jgi:hypothetical protein